MDRRSALLSFVLVDLTAFGSALGALVALATLVVSTTTSRSHLRNAERLSTLAKNLPEGSQAQDLLNEAAREAAMEAYVRQQFPYSYAIALMFTATVAFVPILVLPAFRGERPVVWADWAEVTLGLLLAIVFAIHLGLVIFTRRSLRRSIGLT